MSNLFNSIQVTAPRRNVFDLSHDVKMSLNMGELIPCLTLETVPGDKFHIGAQSMFRLAPMLAPIMHKVDITVHFFFVPNRIIWPNWENFITNTPVAGSVPAAPYYANVASTVGSISDYMGLPTDGGNLDKVSALPFAAYQKIFNEYYRDQNLVAEVPDTCTDGLNSTSTNNMRSTRRRAWQHDYFTAALPFAQKGDAATIPMGTLPDANVAFQPTSGTAAQGQLYRNDPTPMSNGSKTVAATVNTGTTGAFRGQFTMDGANAYYDPMGTLVAKTSLINLQATTINSLRRAFRLQEWLEKNARGGTRYIELIRSHFGTSSSDKRMQRPEYLGGSKAPMIISEVLQTSETAATPQGNMAGRGSSVDGGKTFSFYCEEHGFIMGILSVMPKTAYSQGIPRQFSKFDPLAYYWPSFANIGEQEVLNREIYYRNGDGAVNDQTFGYVPRYSEYKYLPARIAGEFNTSLAYWHMGRLFSSRPNLNSSFITSDPTHRIFAVVDENVDKVYCHMFHQIKAIRPMPKYGTPSF